MEKGRSRGGVRGADHLRGTGSVNGRVFWNEEREVKKKAKKKKVDKAMPLMKPNA